jgi:hypothetical protein
VIPASVSEQKGDVIMYVCVLCRFETELDDVIAPVSSGRCVCLRCFTRETETAVAMSIELRRDVAAALSGAAS